MAASLIGINLQTEFFQQFSGEYGVWLSAGPEDGRSGRSLRHRRQQSRGSGQGPDAAFVHHPGRVGRRVAVDDAGVDGGQMYVVDMGDGTTLGVRRGRGPVGHRHWRCREPAGKRAGGFAGRQRALPALPGSAARRAERAGLHRSAAGHPVAGGRLRKRPTISALGGFEEFPDASESCADYASQEEAQAAYDAAESDTFDLDQDFDGEVCEDFFATIRAFGRGRG